MVSLTLCTTEFILYEVRQPCCRTSSFQSSFFLLSLTRVNAVAARGKVWRVRSPSKIRYFPLAVAALPL
jgi:hypothetical protein